MRVVIVGASVAGVSCLRTLRSSGWDDEIVLVNDELELPYDKPPLSKQVLSRDGAAFDARLLNERELAESGVVRMFGAPAERLDRERRTVTVGGMELEYGVLVIATGARPRRLAGLPESVQVIRSLADAARLRESLSTMQPVLVIGGGVLGLEVAAAARRHGCETTVVDAADRVLARGFSEQVSRAVEWLMRARGVSIRTGVTVRELTRVPDRWVVGLSDGVAVDVATVVACVGTTPNVEWLADSGLPLHDGVLADERGQAANGVFAIGDVSRWRDTNGTHAARTEHWSAASEQGAQVALTIIGRPERPPTPSYVWSDLFDIKIQAVGGARTPRIARLTRANEENGVPHYIELYGDPSGRCVRAEAVNWPRAVIEVRRSLARGQTMEHTLDAVCAVAPRR